MKKLFLLQVALVVTVVGLKAQRLSSLTATLQHGESLQAFYGEDAFKQAYQAAPDSGAIITLSVGKFNKVDTIAKSITVIGSGAFGEDKTTFIYSGSSINILANNVTLESIYFNYSDACYIDGVSNTLLKRCYISQLYSSSTHTNTLIDQCAVYNEYAIKNGINYRIQNSTIRCFRSMNTPNNMAMITNCVIWEFFCYYTYSNSSYQGERPYAIYRNNVLGNSSDVGWDVLYPSEFYNNLFIYTDKISYSQTYTTWFDDCINSGNITKKNWSEYYTDSTVGKYPAEPMSKTVLGRDGTPIGIYGGSGFSPLPSIPRIISSTIDSYTDPQGNLNLRISAEVGSK